MDPSSHPWLSETWEFRWATESGGQHSMPSAECEYLGYEKVGYDPRYGSFLMGRIAK